MAELEAASGRPSKGPGERQPPAVAVGTVSALRMLRHPSGQPRPFVRYLDRDPPGIRARRQRDRPFAVPERVADQDVEDLPDGGRRCQAPRQAWFQGNGQPPVPCHERLLPPGAGFGEQRGHVHWRRREARLAAQAVQVRHDGGQVLAPVERVAQRGHLIGTGAGNGRLKADPQCGQRRPQLVRDVGGEGPLSGEEPSEMCGGVLQRLARGVRLPDAESSGPHGEIAVAKRPGVPGEPLKRCGEPHRLPPGDHRGDRDRRGREHRHRRPRPVHSRRHRGERLGCPDRADRLLIGRNGGDDHEVRALDAGPGPGRAEPAGQAGPGRSRSGHPVAGHIVDADTRGRHRGQQPLAAGGERAARQRVRHAGGDPGRVFLQRAHRLGAIEPLDRKAERQREHDHREGGHGHDRQHDTVAQ